MRTLTRRLKEWEERYEAQRDVQVLPKEQELWHAEMSLPEYYALTMSSHEHWYGSGEDEEEE